MRGGWRGFGSGSVLLLSIVVACGRDRGTGAPAGGTGQTPAASDSAAARSSDTAGTGAAVTGASDTAASAAQPSAPAPTPAKSAPARRKPTARKPAAPTPGSTAQAADTQQAASPAETPAASAPAQSGTELRDAYHRAPLDTVPQQTYDGWKQYNLNCARCHGEDVQGTTIAPHLVVSLRPDGSIPTKALFVQTVCAGRPEKGMPAWCALGMEMDKIDAIYSYVKGRSEGKIRQGRPAVKQ